MLGKPQAQAHRFENSEAIALSEDAVRGDPFRSKANDRFGGPHFLVLAFFSSGADPDWRSHSVKHNPKKHFTPAQLFSYGPSEPSGRN